MGGECGTHGVEKRLLRGFCWEALRYIRHLENSEIDGRIILKRL